MLTQCYDHNHHARQTALCAGLGPAHVGKPIAFRRRPRRLRYRPIAEQIPIPHRRHGEAKVLLLQLHRK